MDIFYLDLIFKNNESRIKRKSEQKKGIILDDENSNGKTWSI